ncbi:MAG: helix-turn-helix domain-containing protein [Chthoniobacterales bacterium]
MEGLGEKFQKARTARNLTLDEAARMTKIRPNKLAEIEAEDFSHFPSLAYAKGFVLIYGKFLNVDVSPYLEAFETAEHMTVDGYSYLQDNPAPKPRRTEVVRREPRGGGKSSLLPLVIGIVVLIAGFTLLKLMMDIRRIEPSARDAQALAQGSATATPAVNAASNNVVAPRALPADATPAPTAVAVATPEPIATPLATPPVIATAPTPEPAAASTMAAPPAPDSETEVRRAEPVHPEDLAAAPKPTPRAPSPSPPPSASRPRTQTPPVIRPNVPITPRPTPSRPPGFR